MFKNHFSCDSRCFADVTHLDVLLAALLQLLLLTFLTRQRLEFLLHVLESTLQVPSRSAFLGGAGGGGG